MTNNCNQSEIVKIYFMCLLSLLSLFLGFFMNFWGVADQQWFENHQRDSESLIIGRIVKSAQDGVFSSGGLTGIGGLGTIPASFSGEAYEQQYNAYYTGQRFGAYTTYDSQIGGQGMLFSILNEIISVSPQEKIHLFHWFTSVLLSITLTAIILWFYLEFGWTVALFVLASAVFSQWLVVFGRNLWWSMWAFYLPLAVIMYYLRFRWESMKMSHFMLGVVVFIVVFIKCLFNGYEYIASTLLMMAVPFIYYSILNRLTFRKFLAGVFTMALSSGLAISFSFVILCFQISSVQGSFLDGVNHIVWSLAKRTHGNSQSFSPIYRASLEVSTIHVVLKYLNGTFFDANNYLSSPNAFISEFLFKIRYLYLIFLFLIMSGTLYHVRNRCVTEREKQKHVALVFATWFSLLAPLSWFVVFKAHSYIHTHMNYIVWQMPFVFFGFAICGLVVKSLFDLPPINRTSHFSKKSIKPENDGHENKQIQRRTDHWFPAAGRGRDADQGDRTQTWLQ